MNPDTIYTNDTYQNQAYANQGAGQAVKKKIILAAGALFLILILLWASGRSSISIEVKKPAGAGEISYTVTDKSGKAATKTTTENTFKKSLAKGSYQITVRQGDTTYVSYVQTKGFFGQTKVSAMLESESARRFVGVNPGDCMYYIGSTLLSSACGLGYEALKIHKPATDTTPTLTESIVPQQIYGPLEGVAYTRFGTVALIQQSLSEEQPRGHYAGIVSDALTDSTPIFLEGLAAGKAFSIKAYREGFIAYGTDFKDIYYIADLAAAPVKLTVTPPKDTTLQPYGIGVSSDAVVVMYSNRPNDGIVEATDTGSNNDANTVVTVLAGTSEKNFSFKGNVKEALYCGKDRLCVLTGDILQVYDIRGTKARPLFVVPGTKTMDMTSKGLVAVSGTGTLLLNIDKQQGFVEYTLGKYAFCGLTTTRTGYVVCVQTPKGQRNALFIDQTNRTNDNVDKKVMELVGTPNVSYVSAYGNIIYVVPDYGATEYNVELGIDTYNPATVQKVNAAIAAAGEKTGLNKPPYKVISTGF